MSKIKSISNDVHIDMVKKGEKPRPFVLQHEWHVFIHTNPATEKRLYVNCNSKGSPFIDPSSFADETSNTYA